MLLTNKSILKINEAYLGMLSRSNDSGIFPLFGFAVIDWIAKLENVDAADEYPIKDSSLASFDFDLRYHSDLEIFGMIRSVRPSIIVANVIDVYFSQREECRKMIADAIKKYIRHTDTPMIAIFSHETYEDRLAFFIYDLSKLSEEHQVALVDGFVERFRDDFIIKNFDYDEEEKKINFVKPGDVTNDDTSAWVDVDDDNDWR